MHTPHFSSFGRGSGRPPVGGLPPLQADPLPSMQTPSHCRQTPVDTDPLYADWMQTPTPVGRPSCRQTPPVGRSPPPCEQTDVKNYLAQNFICGKKN